MRLIHVGSHLLEEFFEPNIPPYVILSHRWEDDEVLFSDVGKGCYQNRKGFYKLNLVCQKAVELEIDYVWIDTCCIDKSSSSELSEAINSMFRWYQQSILCYAYLSDVEFATAQPDTIHSRWFDRGWTLQELIAPRKVVFYTKTGDEIGSRRQLSYQISRRTRIQEFLLSRTTSIDEVLHNFTVAQKMSWASFRETTRLEDKAYCLLGIFGVNMPLLYGEGSLAFTRLQEEIIRTGSDLSILVWPLSNPMLTHAPRDLLAESPDDFRGCHAVVKSYPSPGGALEESSFTITNSGLQIGNPLMLTYSSSKGNEKYALSLGCSEAHDMHSVIALKIRLSDSANSAEELASAKRRTCYLGWLSEQIDDIHFVRAAFFEPVLSSDWSTVTILKRRAIQQVTYPRIATHPHEYLWFILPSRDSALWKEVKVWPYGNETLISSRRLVYLYVNTVYFYFESNLKESFLLAVRYLLREEILRFGTVKDVGDSFVPQNQSTATYDISSTCRAIVSARHIRRNNKTIFQLQIDIERPQNLLISNPDKADSNPTSHYQDVNAINAVLQELYSDDIDDTKGPWNLNLIETCTTYDWRSPACINNYVKTVLLTLGPLTEKARFHGYAGMNEQLSHAAAEMIPIWEQAIA